MKNIKFQRVPGVFLFMFSLYLNCRSHLNYSFAKWVNEINLETIISFVGGFCVGFLIVYLSSKYEKKGKDRYDIY
jgi:uncharacterized membrane protein YdcZ (DUF606 family)